MSVTEEEQGMTRAAARVSALLKEYTKKLRDLSVTVREVQDRYSQAQRIVGSAPHLLARAQSDFDAIRFGYKRLSTAADDLARQASQMVENGKLDAVTRLELSLRAAEFEAALQETGKRITAGPRS